MFVNKRGMDSVEKGAAKKTSQAESALRRGFKERILFLISSSSNGGRCKMTISNFYPLFPLNYLLLPVKCWIGFHLCQVVKKHPWCSIQ